MRRSEPAELLAISSRLMTALMSFRIEPSGDTGANFRSAVGRFLTSVPDMIADHTLGTRMFECFELARLAGVTIAAMNTVRILMFAEKPIWSLSVQLINTAIILSFVEQSMLISQIEFKSRADVYVVMDAMALIVDDIKLNRSELFDVSDYRNFVDLSAALVQHLSETERKLPRIVNYTFSAHLPSLTVANFIYGDGGRSEELLAENKTVHPAFMQRDLVALSR
jgi:hypothetical protein